MKSQTQSAAIPPAATTTGRRLLDEMLEREGARGLPAELAAVVVGRLVATAPVLAVVWEGLDEPRAARTTATVGPRDVGREVTLVFERGDPNRPIVTGVLQDRVPATAACVGVEVDGTALALEGRERVVLRCGKASITLTRAGKVLIQGAYVSSRSSGVHRILGASVEIN